ncbi:hypothetical protein [Rhizobacter sp. OV335]|uniref:hypothetical protein n=1 Tax=Rhizobacter sp. OV335 TaxID=1500264 RepID=UPI0011612395|nr:hypothetical protein [Rhizobacter sp. OV335]
MRTSSESRSSPVRSSTVIEREDSRKDQRQEDVGADVEEVRSCAKSFLKSLAGCLAGTAVVVGIPALISNLGIMGCGVGIVLNEFNCSAGAAVGLGGVALTTGLVSVGAYFLSMELGRRLSGQQQPQDASTYDASEAGSVSSSSGQFDSSTESSVELSSQDLPPQKPAGQELDP